MIVVGPDGARSCTPTPPPARSWGSTSRRPSPTRTGGSRSARAGRARTRAWMPARPCSGPAAGVRDVAARGRAARRDERLAVGQLPGAARRGPAAISGLVISFRDTSERDREHRRLVESQERLREAHEVARLGELGVAAGDRRGAGLPRAASRRTTRWCRSRTALDDLLAPIARGERDHRGPPPPPRRPRAGPCLARDAPAGGP